jgi:protein tyrosine phosphatase
MHAKFTDLEWQARQRLLEGLKASEQQEAGVDAKSPWTRLKGDDVALRNRYLNVDPYENNRIRLNVPANESDYINASPIRLPTTKQGEKRYVATQVSLSPIHPIRRVQSYRSIGSQRIYLTSLLENDLRLFNLSRRNHHVDTTCRSQSRKVLSILPTGHELPCPRHHRSRRPVVWHHHHHAVNTRG